LRKSLNDLKSSSKLPDLKPFASDKLSALSSTRNGDYHSCCSMEKASKYINFINQNRKKGSRNDPNSSRLEQTMLERNSFKEL